MYIFKICLSDNYECFSTCSRQCAVECGQNLSFLRNMAMENCDDGIRIFYVVLIVILVIVICIGCITIMLVIRKLMCVTYITNKSKEPRVNIKDRLKQEGKDNQIELSSSNYSTFLKSSTCASTIQDTPIRLPASSN